MAKARLATLTRKTTETDITVKLAVDGKGSASTVGSPVSASVSGSGRGASSTSRSVARIFSAACLPILAQSGTPIPW